MRAPVPFVAPKKPVAVSAVVREDVPLAAVDPAQWDALCGDHPFLRHAFLSALHDTGCASPRTGWTPRYLTAWDAGRLAGAMPLYAKSHSYGEYVFDWGWAEAWRRHGRRYYPKLVAAVPFTPVTGPRTIAADAATRRALVDTALARVADGTHSSLHLLFVPDGEAAELGAAGLTARRGIQFHWTDAGWRDFADFLDAMTREKRKKIRQERAALVRAGVTFERKTGAAIGSADWAYFFRCYETTYREHESTPYLTLECFERIGEALRDRLLMVIGSKEGRPVCAALDVFDDTTMWGRYWGATETLAGLHFEACYYQAIEDCLARGIRRFEGGAQGVHKLARGLEAAPTASAHAIGDRTFGSAIADFCARERRDVDRRLDELRAATPFKAPPPAS